MTYLCSRLQSGRRARVGAQVLRLNIRERRAFRARREIPFCEQTRKGFLKGALFKAELTVQGQGEGPREQAGLLGDGAARSRWDEGQDVRGTMAQTEGGTGACRLTFAT